MSSGFGRHLAEQLLTAGERVVGTVRRPETVADLAESHPDTFRSSSTPPTPSAASTSW
ncbi:hypothetical protein [Streptomyces cellulosae]|uniref:NAD(P)-binding domain-containing protein n=1 Tax=Streptomyces cellulosae TaxID=1968 RepID=A0ABW7YHU6_STRCE